jgi:TetR/AcrR family transcriptional repressor of nem operon
VVSRTEQKEQTRQDILASAMRLLRERGIGGTSVADVMKGAGLTVGGFYAHFASKEDLVGAALRAAMQEMRGILFSLEGGEPGREAIDPVLQRYLSRAHRDQPAERSCPLPAVVGEAAQAGAPVRDAIAEELQRFADEVGARLPGTPAERRARGLATIALMLGGLGLARAVRGTALSDELLKACREYARSALRGF